MVEFLFKSKNLEKLFKKKNLNINYDSLLSIGHSFGGATALLSAYSDKRIK